MYGYSIKYRLLCMVQLNIKRIMYGSIKCCIFKLGGGTFIFN